MKRLLLVCLLAFIANFSSFAQITGGHGFVVFDNLAALQASTLPTKTGKDISRHALVLSDSGQYVLKGLNWYRQNAIYSVTAPVAQIGNVVNTEAVWKNPNISVIAGEVVNFIYNNDKWQSERPLTIEDYGAKTTSLDNAIAIMKCSQYENIVRIPKGVYLSGLIAINQSLLKDIIFEGKGDSSVIKKLDNYNQHLFANSDATKNCTFRNFKIDGNKANNQPSHDLTGDFTNLTIDNMLFENAAAWAVYQTEVASFCNINITNSRFLNAARHYDYPVINPVYSNNTTGFIYTFTKGIQNIRGNKFINNEFTDIAQSHRNPGGVLIDNIRADAPATKVTISDNYFKGTGQSSTVANGGNYIGSIYLYSGCQSGEIHNNIFENISYLAVGVYNSSNISVKNNKVLSVNFNSEIGNSIGIIDYQANITNTFSQSNIEFSNNIVENATSSAVLSSFLKASANSTILKKIKIADNEMKNNTGFAVGVVIGNIDGLEVSNNTMPLMSRTGLYIDNAVNDAKIINNKFKGATYGIEFTTASTDRNVLLEGNTIQGSLGLFAQDFDTIRFINNHTTDRITPRGNGKFIVEGYYEYMDIFAPVSIEYVPHTFYGIGSPEGVVKGNKGDKYYDGANLYIKTSSIFEAQAVKNTGWVLQTVVSTTAALPQGSATTVASTTQTVTLDIAPTAGTSPSRFDVWLESGGNRQIQFPTSLDATTGYTLSFTGSTVTVVFPNLVAAGGKIYVKQK